MNASGYHEEYEEIGNFKFSRKTTVTDRKRMNARGVCKDVRT